MDNEQEIAELEKELKERCDSINDMAVVGGRCSQIQCTRCNAEYIHQHYTKRVKLDREDRFWKTTNEILREIKAHWWITEGRGSYSWNDKHYQEETLHAFNAVKDIIEEAQKESNAQLQADQKKVEG